jgi:disulfide bond formation protein DsbB
MQAMINKFFRLLVEGIKAQPLVAGAWGLAVIATLGSLFFSEVWMLIPCKLCWWQRIFMYPLVLVLGEGLLLNDKKVRLYGLPLAIVGLIIAGYHNVLYYQANYLYGVSETILTACSGGVSCTNQQLEWFGFVSIPLLSLMAFLIITLLLWQKKGFRK